MPLPRSFLYVPANREKFLDKAIGLPADALLLDLEDSVPVAGEGKCPGRRARNMRRRSAATGSGCASTDSTPAWPKPTSTP